MSFKEKVNDYNNKVKELNALDERQKDDIYNEASELIEYFENMSSKAEEKRNSIYASSVNALDLIIAFLTLIITINVNNKELVPFFIPIYTFAAISLINEFFVIVVYWMQSSCKYVSKDARLTDYGNYWKRFYYGNAEILKISTSLKNFFKVSGKTQNNAFDEDSVVAYLSGLNFVIEQYTKEKSEEKVVKNIKQLYLMQVLNYYKNRYNMSLTLINNCFTGIKIVGVIVSIIIALIIY